MSDIDIDELVGKIKEKIKVDPEFAAAMKADPMGTIKSKLNTAIPPEQVDEFKSKVSGAFDDIAREAGAEATRFKGADGKVGADDFKRVASEQGNEFAKDAEEFGKTAMAGAQKLGEEAKKGFEKFKGSDGKVDADDFKRAAKNIFGKDDDDAPKPPADDK